MNPLPPEIDKMKAFVANVTGMTNVFAALAADRRHVIYRASGAPKCDLTKLLAAGYGPTLRMDFLVPTHGE